MTVSQSLIDEIMLRPDDDYTIDRHQAAALLGVSDQDPSTLAQARIWPKPQEVAEP